MKCSTHLTLNEFSCHCWLLPRCIISLQLQNSRSKLLLSSLLVFPLCAPPSCITLLCGDTVPAPVFPIILLTQHCECMRLQWRLGARLASKEWMQFIETNTLKWEISPLCSWRSFCYLFHWGSWPQLCSPTCPSPPGTCPVSAPKLGILANPSILGRRGLVTPAGGDASLSFNSFPFLNF